MNHGTIDNVEDITYCAANCKVINCSRQPSNIKRMDILHSFADFAPFCESYIPKERKKDD